MKSSSTGVDGASDEPVTTPVTTLAAETDPAEFVAVSKTRNVEPTSPRTTKYVDPVAPPIATQFAPPASHRCHCSPNTGAGDPDHTPGNTLNTEPTCATPDTTGNTEFTGGVDGITEKLDALVAVPPGVVTAIGPLVAPEGTVAVICVAELTVKVAAVPLNVTALAPLSAVPVIVTVAPTAPFGGAKLEIVGEDELPKESTHELDALLHSCWR